MDQRVSREDMHMSGKPEAIEACCCPRGPEEVLLAPRCAVQLDLGEREGPIFVTMPAQLDCPCGRRYSYGEFCYDLKRIKLYREYGV